jgi:8-oxo-dGTP pyrophosphatase MutT (NUDIX family)
VTDDARVLRVDRLACRVVAHDWAFGRDAKGDIAAHWRDRTKVNPTLFDGRVLLASRVKTSVDSGGLTVLEADFFETRFSRFLAWRDFGFPDREVYNCFSMPALRSADGAFLLGEMGPRHSCAGQLYFPCGTPDRGDIRGETVDLGGSIVRELAEETGVRVTERMFSPSWRVVFDGQRVACVNIIDWLEPAQALLARVESHIAAESKPELVRAHMIRACEELTDRRIPAFMAAFLAQELQA